MTGVIQEEGGRCRRDDSDICLTGGIEDSAANNWQVKG